MPHRRGRYRPPSVPRNLGYFTKQGRRRLSSYGRPILLIFFRLAAAPVLVALAPGC
jgi:hypothetical protein